MNKKRYTREELNDAIKRSKEVDIEIVLSALGVIKNNDTGLYYCPYHSDKTASAGVYTNKNGHQQLKCFACMSSRESKGNIDLVMDLLGLDLLDACNYILTLNGQALYYDSDNTFERKLIKQRTVVNTSNTINTSNTSNTPKKTYKDILKEEKDGKYKKYRNLDHNWLYNRGIVVTDRLEKIVKSRFTKSIKAILDYNNIEIGHYYMCDSNCIKYHFKDEKIFIVKTYKNDVYNKIKDKKERIKVVYGPTTYKIIKNILVPIEERETFYICEGIEDALSLVQAGVKGDVVSLNSVSNSSALMEDILKDPEKFRKQYKKIVLCLDNDESGIKFETYLRHMFEQMGLKVEKETKTAGFHDINDYWVNFLKERNLLVEQQIEY